MAQGIICLTFDDKDVQGWTGIMPLLDQYQARATFSFSGVIDDDAIACMKVLREHGQTIGLHTVHHADAPEYIAAHGAAAYLSDEIQPQLDACAKAGIAPGVFAFPNNKYNDEALALLSPLFHHFRAGTRGVAENSFIALDKLSAGCRVMQGVGLGEYYHTQDDDVHATLQRTARNHECVTFFSHSIVPEPRHVHMPIRLLEKILAWGAELDCDFKGFDDLPR